MTGQKQAQNINKTKPTQILVISIVILVAAIGIGMVIRKLRTNTNESQPVVQVDENQNDTLIEEPPEIVYIAPPVEEVFEPIEEVVIEPEPEPEPVRVETPVYRNDDNSESDYYDEQVRQDVTQWVSWLQTLSQEERTALFRGSIMSFMQLMQRWQYIPPEQVAEERAFLEELIQGWRDLPPEDRQQGIDNIQYQLEQWLQSGQQYYSY